MTESATAPEGAPRPTVLVIDDEAGLRDVLSAGLSKRNYEVSCASDGEMALQMIRNNKYDLAICDIMMPGINGVSVLKELKETCPTIEVIMVTGYATLETAVDSMKQGAYDYITKPFSINNLCNILDKALERRRLKAKVDDLEELNRLKSELLSIVSHELRTPMACIMGFVSLLLSGVYGAVSGRQREPLERTLTSAENLLLLINNILDLSKLSAQRMDITEDVFDLRIFGQEVIGAMEPLATRKGLSLSLEAPEEIWVKTDRSKLKQMLINLVGNSIKFTEKGTVTLRLLTAAEPTRIAIEVIDTGIGIKKENLPLLFQEFRQLDSSTTRRYGGTGLGLSIVKKMLDLIHGTIRVESVFGSGSTFFLSLPVRTSAPAANFAPPAPSGKNSSNGRHGKNTVLCIDDDSMVLKLLADSLEATDFEFVGAISGAEGLALARQLHPQIITLDLMMPHMDGWSVLHMLKQDPVLKNIPVFIVSIVDNKPLAFSLGVSGYLLKPFTREQLLGALSAVQLEATPHALVVDDDEEALQMVSRALQEEGYVVDVVSSGDQALKRLNQCKPEILLLDLVMPAMSGFDVLYSMDTQNMTDIPTIVMVEGTLSKEQEAYLKRRVQAILRKKSDNIAEVVKKLRGNLALSKKAA